MQDKYSSKSVFRPEFIENQITSLKPISPTNKSNSSEFSEIKSPLIIKCISLNESQKTFFLVQIIVQILHNIR